MTCARPGKVLATDYSCMLSQSIHRNARGAQLGRGEATTDARLSQTYVTNRPTTLWFYYGCKVPFNENRQETLKKKISYRPQRYKVPRRYTQRSGIEKARSNTQGPMLHSGGPTHAHIPADQARTGTDGCQSALRYPGAYARRSRLCPGTHVRPHAALT